MINHYEDDEVQEVIDALLADEAFMDSLDRLIDGAEDAQAWMEAVMPEQEDATAGRIWQP
jgi:hypothetical protein